MFMTHPPERLTHTERSCLQAVARGETVAMIADKLGTGTKTVKHHLHSARTKLMATTTIEAIARAMKQGLIE
jgi:DNA-binding NarL/FixJ family response regulator